MKIPKIKLVPQPSTENGKNAIGYEWNKKAGTRHKLGGEPDGLKQEEFPICTACKSQMNFYAQIDSIGENYDLADCMVIHQFVCFHCFEVSCRLTQTLV